MSRTDFGGIGSKLKSVSTQELEEAIRQAIAKVIGEPWEKFDVTITNVNYAGASAGIPEWKATFGVELDTEGIGHPMIQGALRKADAETDDPAPS